ncbi:MAG: zf-HC2 domain-containing protein [Candidatus Zixiibacteriota bacterium]
MRCRKVRSFLSIYCNGETAPDEKIQIEQHLEGCGSCRREADIYKSLNKAVKALPGTETSEDFNARLFQKIGREGFAEAKSKAHFPGRIPRIDFTRLATYAATAVIVIGLGLGIAMSDKLFSSSSPRIMSSTEIQKDDNLYLTVQPVDNPLLNEKKSVSEVVQQYNRFREYSRALRASSGSEMFSGQTRGIALTSAQSAPLGANGFRVRPVVKNYLVIP